MTVLVNGKDNILIDIQRDAEYSEEHAHHKVRWFGKLNPQTATNWCVKIDTGLTQLYRAISGNGVYGADANDEAQLFGTADIPISGMATGDFDQVLIVANSSITLYLCRIVWGTGTLAEAVAADQYSEFPFIRGDSDNNRKIQVVPTPLIPVTIGGLPVKVWAQCMNATNNATIDFVVGVHGYGF
jgi:hypothetical protein